MKVNIIMASIFTQPGFINSYLIDNLEDEEEEVIVPVIREENVLVCNLCKDLCIRDCNHIISFGSSLHRLGLEARDFDIEMNCGGNSVKAWINSLDITHIVILSRKINLPSYCKMLVSENLITLEQAKLNCKENYTVCLYYYYYLKPAISILQKKMNFQIKKIIKDDHDENFECPYCITFQKVDDKVMFQCSHSVCNSCFHSYIDSLKTGIEPTCGICRDVVKRIYVKKEDYLCRIEKKYL